MDVLSGKNIKVKCKDYTICLDDASKTADYCFLSHAHTDHLFRTSKPVICSEETRKLAELRGYSLNKAKDLDNVKMVDSGHILGSKSLIISEDDKRLVFTADFSTKSRGFIKGFKPVKCDSLIIESTFGNPLFIFPEFNDEMKRAKDWVDDNAKRNYLSVLMGYPLGKIQELQHYFQDYDKSAHEKVLEYNNLFKTFGVDLGDFGDADKSQVLFTTPMRSNNNYFNRLKKERGVKFAVFSGWNIIPSYRSRFGADAGFTVSDHADFKELLSVVSRSCAKNIYVNHGSSDAFASFLRMEGFNAKGL